MLPSREYIGLMAQQQKKEGYATFGYQSKITGRCDLKSRFLLVWSRTNVVR